MKKKILTYVTDYDIELLNGSFKEVIEKLEKFEEDLKERYPQYSDFEIKSDHGWSDPDLAINGWRMETNVEYKARLDREEKERKKEEKAKERRRKQYEKLKKEFE